MCRLNRFTLVICLLFILAVNAEETPLAASPIKAQLSKDKVETGEVFAYSLTVSGSFSSPKIIPPKFTGLNVISQNQSQSYSQKEGKTEVKIKLVYHLIAPNPGTFTIEPAALTASEGKFTSEAFTVTAQGRPIEEKKKILPHIQGGTEI